MWFPPIACGFVTFCLGIANEFVAGSLRSLDRHLIQTCTGTLLSRTG